MNAPATAPIGGASTLEAALAYARRGLHVLPLWEPVAGICTCPRGADCGRNTGKHPRTAHGLRDATTDERTIRAWWAQWPAANVGIALAASDLIALDVDTPEAYAMLAEIEREHGAITTARQRSGSGNLHVLAKRPAFDIRGNHGGITLRGKNYIVAAPSVHKSGGRYEWISPPWETPPIELPAALAEAFRRHVATEPAKPSSRTLDNELQVKRAIAYVSKMEPAIEGEHGEAKLFKACAKVVHGYGLSDSDALAVILEAFNPRCVPPWGDDELDQVKRKISEARRHCDDSRLRSPVEDRPRQARCTREEAPDMADEEPPIDEAYAPPFTEADVADREEFARDGEGRIYATQANVILAIKKLGVALRCDEFARTEMIAGLPGFGPRCDEHAMRRLRLEIDARFSFRISKEFFYDVTTDQAWLHRFHPVRDYLASLPSWDTTRRIDEWLIEAGAADTAYTRAVSRLVLIAAVRRIRHPGCKFDEMPVLESRQGTNKSSALRILAVCDEWFTDELHLSADSKEMMEQTAGKWIVEAGEMKGQNRGDAAALKSWLSRQVDEARMSYDRKPTIAPRQFIVIGTTNETEGYLKDATGNRRFWPVRIERFDLGRLARVRDQLWAEAAHAEVARESIRLSPELWGTAAAEQEDRRLEDPMVPILYAALGDITGQLRVVDALRIVGVDGKATQDQGQRLGLAMRELGWSRSQRRDDGRPAYWYVRGGEVENRREIIVEITGEGSKREAGARWRQ